MPMVYTDRVLELGAAPSTGTVSDSYDNAPAEAVNGLYKTELIRQQGPWRTVEQLELATLNWVWWWNNQRLHGELNMHTPTETEQQYYAAPETSQPQTTSPLTNYEHNPGLFMLVLSFVRVPMRGDWPDGSSEEGIRLSRSSRSCGSMRSSRGRG